MSRGNVSGFHLCSLTLAGIVTVFCAGCSQTSPSASFLDPPVKNCQYARFLEYQYEHFVYEIPEPFVSGLIAGKVVNADGWWPEDVSIQVQIYSMMEEKAEVRSLEVTPRGEFSVSDLTPGFYCLKVSSDGWQTAIAAVRVDPAATVRDPIRVEMILGV